AYPYRAGSRRPSRRIRSVSRGRGEAGMAVAGGWTAGGRAAGRTARAAVVVLGCLVVPLFWAARPATAAAFLEAQTTATAVHVTVTQQPASSIVTASLIDDAVAYAASDFDSGGSSEA